MIDPIPRQQGFVVFDLGCLWWVLVCVAQPGTWLLVVGFGGLDQAIKLSTYRGFSKDHWFGVEVCVFEFGVGSHHRELASEGIGSTGSAIN